MKSKEALIQRLREEKSQMALAAENVSSAARRAEKEREAAVRPQDVEGTLVSTPDCTGRGTHVQASWLTHHLLLNAIALWAEDQQKLPVRGLACFPPPASCSQSWLKKTSPYSPASVLLCVHLLLPGDLILFSSFGFS